MVAITVSQTGMAEYLLLPPLLVCTLTTVEVITPEPDTQPLHRLSINLLMIPDTLPPVFEPAPPHPASLQINLRHPLHLGQRSTIIGLEDYSRLLLRYPQKIVDLVHSLVIHPSITRLRAFLYLTRTHLVNLLLPLAAMIPGLTRRRFHRPRDRTSLMNKLHHHDLDRHSSGPLMMRPIVKKPLTSPDRVNLHPLHPMLLRSFLSRLIMVNLQLLVGLLVPSRPTRRRTIPPRPTRLVGASFPPVDPTQLVLTHLSPLFHLLLTLR